MPAKAHHAGLFRWSQNREAAARTLGKQSTGIVFANLNSTTNKEVKLKSLWQFQSKKTWYKQCIHLKTCTEAPIIGARQHHRLVMMHTHHARQAPPPPRETPGRSTRQANHHHLLRPLDPPIPVDPANHVVLSLNQHNAMRRHKQTKKQTCTLLSTSITIHAGK